MRPLIALLVAATLAGCGGNGGYVESDIPGLAPALMQMHRERVNPRCPVGTQNVRVYAEASTRTTEVGLKRERLAYQVHC